MASFWYIRESGAGATMPQSYGKTIGVPSCWGNRHICAVYATEQFIDGVSRPVIDSALLEEMVEALNGRKDTIHVKLRFFD